MARLKLSCPLCQKTLELVGEENLGTEKLKIYKCGHAFTESFIATLDSDQLDLESLDGTKKTRPYQTTGVKFIVESDFCCILGDQMRLGKTPQALIAAKNSKDKTPILILVRSANIWKWKEEVNTWYDNNLNSVWIIQGTKNWIPPGFQVYICSMDTFGRRGMSDTLLSYGFKLVIADECHSFKNTDSNRSQALVSFLKNIERSELEQEWEFNCPFCKETWMEKVTIKIELAEAHKRTSKTSHCPKCFTQVQQSAAAHVKVQRNCGVIMLSGTPIKNRADEFFVPLNLVSPERFPSLENFRRRWLIQDNKGKWSRVSPLAMERFKAEISSFYLRREKEDVYAEVPKLNRLFTPIEITDERLKKAYNQVLDEIELINANSRGNWKFFNTIGELQKLRQICGLAKVQFVADYAEAFLMDSERQKLAIGVHHHSVRDSMQMQLAHLGVCKLDGQDSAQQKDYIAHKYFEKAPEQILLLGMMAAKEGMELPYIDTVLIMEREWSSADEEQFEFRFYNPDLDYLKARGLENHVTNIEYVIAKGTIDEFFYDLVEAKRKIFGETIGNNWSIGNDPSSFKDLMERTLANRL